MSLRPVETGRGPLSGEGASMSCCSPFPPAARRRLGVVLLVAAITQLPIPAAAAETVETGFVRRTFHDDAGDHGYVVYLPRNYTPEREWPVMLFLHGAGERGRDGFRQAEVGLGAMIRRWKEFPWVVVFPQAEDTRGPIKTVWAADAPDGRRALAILDEVERTYRIDGRRRALTGWSMGGRGAYMLAAAFPERWSAVLPIAGWADLDLAPALAKVPLWSFHGTADSLVAFDDDRALIEATRAAGGAPYFTVLPNEGHYIWRTVYASPVVFDWLRDPASLADRAEPPVLEPILSVELPLAETMGPFVPAIELDRAIAVRIGPDLFRDLSEVAEQEFAKVPLTGSMPGTRTATTEAGIKFDVRTSRISYRVPVSDVEVSATERGTLRLKLSVADARLVIGRTEVRGGILCKATAGAIHVVFGSRAPIPVEADVRPYVADGVLRLKTEAVRFSLPRGGWYVTRPAVDSHSLFLPANRVANSLVEGVYSSKAQIERDFRRSVSDAIDGKTFALPEVSDDQLLTALWPIPAYRPRIKPRLQEVEVSEHGMAAVFGLSVAAVDPFEAPGPPERIDLGLTPDHVARGDLAIAAAENLVAPLTKQLIDAGLAHVNVVDIPGDQYASLADRRTLADAIPALRSLPDTAEVRTELYLRQPLGLGETDEIEQVCAPDGCYSLFDLRMPDMTAVVSVRDTPEEPWRDFAEFRFDVAQRLRLGLGAETGRGREVVSACAGSPTLRTTPKWLTEPPADDRLDAEAAQRLFEKGWASSTHSCDPIAFLVPDLTLRGYVRRLDRLEPGTRGISAVFEEPETVISNGSQETLIYRTRQPGADWQPATLAPGERREYRASRPLAYESEAGGRAERYDIPPGRDATFKTERGRPGLVLDPLPPPLKPQPQLPGTGG